MTLGEIWRGKSDDELIAASKCIGDYTEEGQRVILAELQRRDLNADTDYPKDSTPAIAHRQNGLVVSLWRGEVPLWQTYWVCGVLTNLLWRVPVFIAAEAGLPLLALTLVGASLVYAVFISVAVWRSAGRYSGRKLWGDLARISVTLGIIKTLADLLLPR